MTLFGKKIPEFLVIVGICLVTIFLVFKLAPAKVKAFLVGA